MLIFKTYCVILLLQWTEDTRGYKNGIATLYSTVDKKYTSCNNSIQSQSLFFEREFWTAHYQIINVFCPVNMSCNNKVIYWNCPDVMNVINGMIEESRQQVFIFFQHQCFVNLNLIPLLRC
jgi:hypothetical protein